MYVAGYIVSGLRRRRRLRVRAAARPLGPLRADRARDPADDRRAGRAGADADRRLGGARRRDDAADQAGRDRGAVQDDARRVRAPPRLVYATTRSSSGSRSRTCSRCSRSTAGTRRSRGSTRCRPTTGRRSTSSGSRSRRWSGSARCSRCSAVVFLVVRIRRKRLPESVWFYRGVVAGRARWRSSR